MSNTRNLPSIEVRRAAKWKMLRDRAQARVDYCETMRALYEADIPEATPVEDAAPTPTPNANVDVVPFDLEREFTRVSASRGARSAVARRLGLSHEHVRQVANGMRVSERVTDELKREMALRGFGVAAEGCGA